MENVKKCLEMHLGDNFKFKMESKDLVLIPEASSIYGIYLHDIVDVVRAFKKCMYISAEIKQGIYIRIY